MTCEEIESLLARWADEDLEPAQHDAVAAHLDSCHACRVEAEAESGARAILHARRDALKPAAPPALRDRLGRLAATSSTGSANRRWSRAALVAAATLVLVFSGITLRLATVRSATVLAAQLAADHVKCHLVERDHGAVDADAVRDRLAARYGFAARVPPGRATEHLRLVGARRCLTGEGTNAHILYRYEGRPLSLYLLPVTRHPAADLDVLGQRAIVWSRHNGTYVLVADEETPHLDQVAHYMQAATE